MFRTAQTTWMRTVTIVVRRLEYFQNSRTIVNRSLRLPDVGLDVMKIDGKSDSVPRTAEVIYLDVLAVRFALYAEEVL